MKIEGLDIILDATKDKALFPAILAAADGRPLGSPLIKSCMTNVDDALLAVWNQSPSTRNVACVHAAGSAVNLYNNGADIESIRVYEDRDGFTGVIHRGKCKKVSNPSLAIYREAVSAISGFVGERITGVGHPCSSVYGKVLAGIYCNQLARSLGKGPEHFFLKVIDHAEAVIAANRSIFNLIAFRLAKTGSLGPEEAKDAFKTFRRIPLSLDESKRVAR